MKILMQRYAKRADFGAIVGVCAIFLIFSLIDFSNWWSGHALPDIIQFTAILGVMAVGQAIMIMVKEIDLSVGSVYGLTGVSFIMLEEYLGVPGAMISALMIAASLGYIQAFITLRGKIPSMIVTLGGLFAFRGIIHIWTSGQMRSLPVESKHHWLTSVFGGELFGIEVAVFWALLVLLAFSVLLWKTRFGNHLLAVGGDPNTARGQGIRVHRVKTAAFMMCSTLAGFAAILTLADRPQTHVTLGTLMELEAIAAAVIGGCVLTGGRGSLAGAMLGAFIITSVRYQLISLGAPSSWYITFVGLVLIASVIFNQLLARWAGHATHGE